MLLQEKLIKFLKKYWKFAERPRKLTEKKLIFTATRFLVVETIHGPSNEEICFCIEKFAAYVWAQII